MPPPSPSDPSQEPFGAGLGQLQRDVDQQDRAKARDAGEGSAPARPVAHDADPDGPSQHHPGKDAPHDLRLGDVQASRELHVAKAQVVWGIFTWVVLGWAVWVRVVRHWAGRRAALASIAGFGAVLLVYVALKLTQPGAERFL